MKKRNGLTLIEMLISIVILGIILVVTITTFTSAYLWINKSGDKTAKIFQEQEEMELMVAERKGVTFAELVMSFLGGSNISVRGGMLKSDNLTTFLSKIPTISRVDLSSTNHVYGQPPASLEVSIETINVPKGSAISMEILNQDGKSLKNPIKSTKILSSTTKNLQNEEVGNIIFDINLPLPYNLQIEPGIYNIAISIEDKGEALLAKPYQKDYIIYPIGKVAVGNGGQIWNSADGSMWYEIKQTLTSEKLNSIIYDGKLDEKKFVAVGDKGNIIYSKDGLNWFKSVGIPSTVDINEVIYTDSELNAFVGIGKNASKGVILISNDGINWSTNEIENTTSFSKGAWNKVSKSALITGEGDNSLGILKNESNIWKFEPIEDITFKGFNNVLSFESEDIFILTKTNLSTKTEIVRYKKNAEDKYVFNQEDMETSVSIDKVLDLLSFSGTAVIVDENGNFYLRTEAEGDYIWENATQIPSLGISGIDKLDIKNIGGTISVVYADKLYNLTLDEVDSKFKWKDVTFKLINPIQEINSITGK